MLKEVQGRHETCHWRMAGQKGNLCKGFRKRVESRSAARPLGRWRIHPRPRRVEVGVRFAAQHSAQVAVVSDTTARRGGHGYTLAGHSHFALLPQDDNGFSHRFGALARFVMAALLHQLSPCMHQQPMRRPNPTPKPPHLKKMTRKDEKKKEEKKDEKKKEEPKLPYPSPSTPEWKMTILKEKPDDPGPLGRRCSPRRPRSSSPKTRWTSGPRQQARPTASSASTPTARSPSSPTSSTPSSASPYIDGKLYVHHTPKFSVFTDDVATGVGKNPVD